MDTLLKVSGLTKTYKHKRALDDVSFEIKNGGIYGFVGENGAGKTTTIRAITGLSRADSGTLEIFGNTNPSGIEQARNKIGAIIESPILYSDRTAMDNLVTHGILYGVSDKNYFQSLLERVDLASTGKKKAGNFSMGMKQRLAIALTLIAKPDFLILDEPTNGLDPVGMVEVRNLLKSLNKDDGLTILVSSHILAELYLLATDYIFISHGRIMQQLSLSELNDKCTNRLSMQTNDVEKAIKVMNDSLKTNRYSVKDNQIELYEGFDDIDKTAHVFAENGVIFTKFAVIGKSLEEYYIEALGGGHNA